MGEKMSATALQGAEEESQVGKAITTDEDGNIKLEDASVERIGVAIVRDENGKIFPMDLDGMRSPTVFEIHELFSSVYKDLLTFAFQQQQEEEEDVGQGGD